MKKTLLLDLDDTLLQNSGAVFFPIYLDALSKHLKHLAEPETVISVLFQATEAMRTNLDPGKNLKQIFDEAFYPQFNTTYAEQKDKIDDFYTNIHPTLYPNPQPLPEVVDFVDRSLEEGFSLVIATDPYFPLQAVHDRLRWAGLSPEKYPFAHITSYETSHFTKPHPAYYAEILAQLGWPESSFVMVGNDIELDIKPAKSFGLASYLTGTHNSHVQSNGSMKHSAGALSDFHEWYKDLPQEELNPTFSTFSPNLEIMRANPAALQQHLAQFSEEDWHHKPAPDEWNPTEIICHFRDVDQDIHIPRFEQVRDHPAPFLEAIDADSWAQSRGYAEQDGPTAFSEFLLARKKLVSILHSLPASIDDKDIQHTIFGPISLDELVKIAARHDRLHIQQLFAHQNT